MFTGNIFTWLWVAWGIAFAIIEGVAIRNDKKDDTLSEHFRKWWRTDTKLGRTIWLGISGIFFAWFVVHIAVAGSV